MEHEVGFKNILLATDGTPHAEAAVDATIQLARYTPAIVRVVHVWNMEVHNRRGTRDVEVHGEAERLVEETVGRLTRAGVMAVQEILPADSHHVAEEIASSARQFGADLVVIGSRGLTSWQSIMHHSVSHHVMAAVDCPVLVVRDAIHRSFAYKRRVMVAVAGGDDVEPAVKAALAVARPVPSIAMVVHVAQAMYGPEGFAYVEGEEEINRTVEIACAELRDGGVQVESTVLRSGPVAAGIAEIATTWDADVIVMGSSRMRDVASLLLGSVSHDLIHTSEVPVLIAERAQS
jgi:nucleotide-binding universal stress UspA family protein